MRIGTLIATSMLLIACNPHAPTSGTAIDEMDKALQ
jgi:hypothetical protein